MLAAVRIAASRGGHQHHWHLQVAAGEVDVLGHQVVDRIEADAEEVDEHQFHQGAHSVLRGPDGGTDEGSLGDRCVADALSPELVQQPAGVAIDAAEGGDVLAHDEDTRVDAHLLRGGLGHGACDGQFSLVGFGHFLSSLQAANTRVSASSGAGSTLLRAN